MFSEFKNFLLRGDVLALAIAVIIGGAFQKIVDSLVADVIMPLIALVLPEGGYEKWMVGPVGMGKFLTAIINFVIIGFVLFLLVKASGKKAEDVK
jgi:large conductance mechanosensitive channel